MTHQLHLLEPALSNVPEQQRENSKVRKCKKNKLRKQKTARKGTKNKSSDSETEPDAPEPESLMGSDQRIVKTRRAVLASLALAVGQLKSAGNIAISEKLHNLCYQEPGYFAYADYNMPAQRSARRLAQRAVTDATKFFDDADDEIMVRRLLHIDDMMTKEHWYEGLQSRVSVYRRTPVDWQIWLQSIRSWFDVRRAATLASGRYPHL